MSLKNLIESDIKSAMLAGDKKLVTILRTIKSVILYAEVAVGAREKGLKDEEVVALLQKEVKKRQESADLYIKSGNIEKAEAEKYEIEIINKYVPSQMEDDELIIIISNTIKELGAASMQDMGKVIAKVKEISAGRADGGRIAKLVKERL